MFNCWEKAALEMTDPLLTKVVCALGLLVALASDPALAECRAPHFRVGQDYGASVFVAVDRRDLGIDKLICLANVLAARGPGGPSFSAVFFDSNRAARSFRPKVEGTPRGWGESGRGICTRSTVWIPRSARRRWTLCPLGFSTPPALITHIGVQPTGAPVCRAEIQGRCILAALEEITYPEGALTAGESSTIQITGVIRPNGGVSNLQVARSNLRLRRRLAKAALRDLKTWRFDPAARDDAFEISYEFEADRNLPRGTPPQLRLIAPNRVSVRAATGP